MTTQVDMSGERNEYNFVADPSFENEVSEWENESVADGGTGPLWTIEHDGAFARSGEGYAERVGQAGTSRRLLNTRFFQIVPEQVIHQEVWLRNAGIIQIDLDYYDKDGVYITTHGIGGSAAGRIVQRTAPPSNAVVARMAIGSGGSVTSRVDDAFAAQFPSHLSPLAETATVGTDSDSSTRTNVNYGDLADTANSPAVDFVAPPNGRIEVTVSAYMKSGAAGDKSCMGYQIIDNTDSSVFQDAADARAACTASANNLTLTRQAEVSGLVPGRSYKARAKYKSAGTITATDRRISTRPATGVL